MLLYQHNYLRYPAGSKFDLLWKKHDQDAVNAARKDLPWLKDGQQLVDGRLKTDTMDGDDELEGGFGAAARAKKIQVPQPLRARKGAAASGAGAENMNINIDSAPVGMGNGGMATLSYQENRE